jgi:Serine dehydrogenase proteinase
VWPGAARRAAVDGAGVDLAASSLLHIRHTNRGRLVPVSAYPREKSVAGHERERDERDDETEVRSAGGSAAGRERRRMHEHVRTSTGDQGRSGEVPGGQAGVVTAHQRSLAWGLALPHQTPLSDAEHSERYVRQALIRDYEARFGCRLVVVVAPIYRAIVTVFEELIFDADPSEDLHLLLDTPGGDGETAVRLVRSAQARCRELTVIVPNAAKSAGTLLVMGAHHIVLGPTSDLGPVDPQLQDLRGAGLYAAKDLIAAVEAAEGSISGNPDT